MKPTIRSLKSEYGYVIQFMSGAFTGKFPKGAVMKIHELVEILEAYGPEEEIEIIHFAENETGDYSWWKIDRVERFIEDNPDSPITLVTGEWIGGSM
jgi:hypothetical protein